MKEVWKDIKGFEGIYQVSNLGRVRSIRVIYLKPQTIGGGYNSVRLYNIKATKPTKPKTKLLHRLIAENFIPNPNKKSCVNHKNGIKTDNRLENLEWVTNSENGLHAYRIGLNYTRDEYRNKLGEYTSKIVIDLQTGIFYNSLVEACRIFGLCPKAFSKKINNINKNNTSLRYA